ncbi:PD-(D/E)XK nuclease family protein [Anaplasma capra]|uniref:PD-(D/E)XK nuclease family protein n=1 Tax=Anaplasma capra TaxID=1562740 RepID=UPI0021D5CCCC|nr:PD-(D/E)XK nuclease family protein [Anaplasma capra]MCU7611431.1 PD-(D/E)XK nuclease family protein [Anaplasma capra]MCU7612130.1 PD-(D/E)XK nuclease family protein [Anaplasma capra]
MSGKVFTAHCSESFVEVVSQYASDQQVGVIVVPSAEDARLFSNEISKLTAYSGAGTGPEILAFSDIEGCALTSHGVAISAAEQLLLLVQFIEKWNVDHGSNYPLRMAGELSSLLDELYVNCVESSALRVCRSDEFGYCRTADFLYELVLWWEREASGLGIAPPGYCIDLFTESLNQRGKKVIVAGVVFSKVFTRFLQSLIGSVLDVAIVLPYVDLELPKHKWGAVHCEHYQYYLVRLLRELGIDRNDIQRLGRVRTNHVVESLFNFGIVEHSLQDYGAKNTENIKLVTCSSEAEEATKVAEILKLCKTAESGEAPAGVAAVCGRVLGERHTSTPGGANCDMDVARSLEGRCIAFIGSNSLTHRIDALSYIEQAEAATLDYDRVIAPLVLCVVEVLLSPEDTVRLLYLLKHPLVTLGYDADGYRELLVTLEVEIIRERSATSFEAIGNVIKEDFQQLEELWSRVMGAVSPLIAVHEGCTISEVAAAHAKCLKLLCGCGTNGLAAHTHALNRIEQFFSLFRNRCTGAMTFSLVKYKEACELLIGAFFARERNKFSAVNLATRDVVIISGLSEADCKPRCSPMLSNWMREKLDLPSAEEYGGRIMYVLYSLFYSSKVWITKSTKDFGVVSEPVWIRYLAFLLKDCAVNCNVIQAISGAATAGASGTVAPNPELAVRKKAMSVLTAKAVNTLINNPYVFYLKYILKMRPVRVVDTRRVAGGFGTVVHGILREYLASVVAEGDYNLLLEIARRKFDAIAAQHPYAFVLWWPKFEKMARNFFEMDSERRSAAVRIEAYKNFFWHVSDEMQVVAMCDRVEYLKDGSVTVVCHKIGSVPSQVDIRCGFASRAVIDAVCVSEGAAVDAVSFSYWKITPWAVEVTQVSDFTEILGITKEGFTKLLLRYAEEMTPFSPREDFSDFSEYELLSRIREGALCPGPMREVPIA